MVMPDNPPHPLCIPWALLSLLGYFQTVTARSFVEALLFEFQVFFAAKKHQCIRAFPFLFNNMLLTVTDV
jgi:hypothetical protein